MTETPERSAEPTTVTGQRRNDDRYDRPSRLNHVLAWVGIVAGVLFIVAVIFFSGFILGRSSGGHYGGWHRGSDGDRDGSYSGQMEPGQTEPGGMMGPGQTEPGGMMRPGQTEPGGMMRPSQSPFTTAPSTPRP